MVVLMGAGPAHAAKPPASDKSAQTKAPFTFSIEPVPAWVVPAQEKPDAPIDRAPLHLRMVDDQTRVDDKNTVRYSHVVRVVNTTAGLSQAAQIEAVFDPNYQSLVFHHVDIIRDGKRSSRLDRRKVQLLQRETQLERRMVDGRVTASLVLDDVRVGDQIDFAMSIRGDNPVFGGRFFDMEWLSPWRGPAAVYQFRLLASESRQIAYRVGAPDVQVSSKVEQGMRETIFRRESVPVVHFDTAAPATATLPHQVQFSEYKDWDDVVKWGRTLFAPGHGPTPLLDKKAEEIRAASSDPEQQLLSALHFVQAEVRYFGTEVGLNSHKPEAPEKVLTQRFGDCKDKASLLVALLQRLDIQAAPVLVSTMFRRQVDAVLPSPLAFDHVIARVELKGQTYWLDGTRAHQTGSLANRQAIGFQRGLPLSATSTGLADMPKPYDAERIVVHDTFRVNRFADGANLESRITYRGDLAEMIRETLASQTMADLEPQIAQPYVRAYPKLKKLAPPKVESSDTDDAITLVQNFAIADFWRFPEQRLLVGDAVQWAIADAIRPPNEPTRRDAFAVGYPGIHRHITTMVYPEDVGQPSSQQADDGDARLAMHVRTDVGPRRTELATEVQFNVDEIAASEWPGYIAMINKLAPRVSITISAPAVSPAHMDQLRKDLQATEESLKKGRPLVTTSVQYQALGKAMVLTTQLDEGRLSPELRAQALTARGVQYDNLGRYPEAAQDFTQAMALSPDTPETLNAAAVNALGTHDFARGLALTERVLARNANDSEARGTRALAKVYMKDYAAARADFESLLKDPAQVRRGYPVVWLALLARQSGQDPAQAVARFSDAQLPKDWPRPIVDWARGSATTDALIASAKTGKESAEHLTEAYYYLGERYLAEGENTRAADAFRKVIDLHVLEFIENAAARHRLESLSR